MNSETYGKLSALDCFRSVFPNVINIAELTVDEKVDFVCSVAEEYGFTVAKDGFTDNKFIRNAAFDKIETAVRQAVLRKLSEKDKNVCLTITDVDTGLKLKRATLTDI